MARQNKTNGRNRNNYAQQFSTDLKKSHYSEFNKNLYTNFVPIAQKVFIAINIFLRRGKGGREGR